MTNNLKGKNLSLLKIQLSIMRHAHISKRVKDCMTFVINQNFFGVKNHQRLNI